MRIPLENERTAMTEYVTIRGFVATQPETRVIDSNGVPVAHFRLASTSRWYDADAKQWREGHTNWFGVSCFRQLGTNVGASIRVGHPVIVQGKLKVKSWDAESGPRTAVEIEAHAVGIDLGYGTAAFSRTAVRTQPEREVPKEVRSAEVGGWTGATAEQDRATAQTAETSGTETTDADGVAKDPAAALA